MDYEKFCSEILDIDPKIRFATVFDEWSVKVGGGMREGVESLLSERASRELVTLATLDWKSRKDMAKWLGKTKDFHIRGFIEAEVLSKIEEPLTECDP